MASGNGGLSGLSEEQGSSPTPAETPKVCSLYLVFNSPRKRQSFRNILFFCSGWHCRRWRFYCLGDFWWFCWAAEDPCGTAISGLPKAHPVRAWRESFCKAGWYLQYRLVGWQFPSVVDRLLDKMTNWAFAVECVGKLAHSDLDERALDALKEFPVDGALTVLKQFLDSNLEHVSNKSAYLCGVMKTYRQKSRAAHVVAQGVSPGAR